MNSFLERATFYIYHVFLKTINKMTFKKVKFFSIRLKD